MLCKLDILAVVAHPLTSIRKASGVRLAANSGVPAATLSIADVNTSGLGITCSAHLQRYALFYRHYAVNLELTYAT